MIHGSGIRTQVCHIAIRHGADDPKDHQHPNARLTPLHRRNMVRCVINKGWTITATAERFQIDPKTVRKWRDR
ncbi:MAG: helix-turn-helix domain-containing protein, partial [Actinomycetota bacterium]|nr:helix-turn-helix domain-containing protein [Actinomycetota bacterium]